MQLTGTESNRCKFISLNKLQGVIQICCLLALAFSAYGTGAREKTDSDLEGLLIQLEKQHGSTKSLAVQVQQKKFFSFMDKPIISQGFIVFAAPNKIRFDITDPFQTTLLDDGKRMLRYEFIEDQWRSLRFGGGKSVKLVMEQIGQWMQGKFSDQEEIFTLSMSIEDPNDNVILNLEPRHKQFRQYIEMIHVHIGDAPTYRVTRIDITEPQGDSFALIFSREQKNKSLPEGCFSDPETAAQCFELFKHDEESKEKVRKKR